MKKKRKQDDFLLALGGIICFAAGFTLLMAIDEQPQKVKNKKSDSPSKEELSALMQTYIELQDFEKAAELKKQIESMP